MTDGHYEVLDPTPDAPPSSRRSAGGWLLRNRLVLLLLAFLIVVVGREVIARNQDVPGAPGAPLIAVIRGLSWDPPGAVPRLVEVELTNVGGRSVAATELQMHGDGMPPGDVSQLNRELGRGERATVKFGVGDPYCVTRASARLDGVFFDAAGVAHTVTLDVEDPDGFLDRVNELACFGGAKLATAEIDGDALLAIPLPRRTTELRIPVTVSNEGSLPILVTDLIVNDRGISQVAIAVPAHQSTEVAPQLALCEPAERIQSLALHGEDFGGRFIQFDLTIDDRTRSYLDDAVDRCPGPHVGVSASTR